MGIQSELDDLATLARANKLIRLNALAEATAALEEHIESSKPLGETRTVLRIVMRLAALYRFFGRYEDEVAVLERLVELYPESFQRSRINARASKARSLLAALRTSDTLPVNVSLRGHGRMSDVEKRLHARAHAHDLAAR